MRPSFLGVPYLHRVLGVAKAVVDIGKARCPDRYQTLSERLGLTVLKRDAGAFAGALQDCHQFQFVLKPPLPADIEESSEGTGSAWEPERSSLAGTAKVVCGCLTEPSELADPAGCSVETPTAAAEPDSLAPANILLKNSW